MNYLRLVRGVVGIFVNGQYMIFFHGNIESFLFNFKKSLNLLFHFYLHHFLNRRMWPFYLARESPLRCILCIVCGLILALVLSVLLFNVFIERELTKLDSEYALFNTVYWLTSFYCIFILMLFIFSNIIFNSQLFGWDFL